MARSFTNAELAHIYDEHPLKKSTILARVQALKGTLRGITELDLAVDEDTEITDQNHIGGLKFLQELAEKAGVESSSLVLDAGCGLGGSSRALAYLYGCKVHGVEITSQRYSDAVDLTELVGLEHLVTFTHGDFLTAELPRKRFDIVLAQSALVHFRDKQKVVSRCANHLKEKGRFALEEVYLKRPASGVEEQLQLDELEDVWKSHISSIDEWFTCLRAAGFRVVLHEDLTGAFEDYYSKLLRISQTSPPGRFAANEVKGWSHAVSLALTGALGFGRIVASLQ